MKKALKSTRLFHGRYVNQSNNALILIVLANYEYKNAYFSKRSINFQQKCFAPKWPLCLFS